MYKFANTLQTSSFAAAHGSFTCSLLFVCPVFQGCAPFALCLLSFSPSHSFKIYFQFTFHLVLHLLTLKISCAEVVLLLQRKVENVA